MTREIFRVWRGGSLLAVLGDERALRVCLPVLREKELVHLSDALLQKRLLARHLSISRTTPFPIEVRDEVWMCRRDEA